MTVRQVQVTFDCADPAALSGFWAEALGYELDDPPVGFASWDEALDAWGVPEERRNDASAVHDPTGAGPRLYFQRVPEPKVTKNRVHLDILVADLDAAVAEVVARGASIVRRSDDPDDIFVTVADPEANELCLVGYL